MASAGPTLLVAEYVLSLENSLATTRQAEDRSLYQSLLADAAGLLAAAASGNAKSDLVVRIERHERLWGQIWLQDPIYRTAQKLWFRAKEALQNVAA